MPARQEQTFQASLKPPFSGSTNGKVRNKWVKARLPITKNSESVVEFRID